MLGRLFRGECDSVLRRGLYRTGCEMYHVHTTNYRVYFFSNHFIYKAYNRFSLSFLTVQRHLDASP